MAIRTITAILDGIIPPALREAEVKRLEGVEAKEEVQVLLLLEEVKRLEVGRKVVLSLLLPLHLHGRMMAMMVDMMISLVIMKREITELLRLRPFFPIVVSFIQSE
jgi:acyl-CoA synthetase (AMP-forming)/AMP-acid ligase II